jgi:hypothetical protein
MRGNSEELVLTQKMNGLTSPVLSHKGEAYRKKEAERHKDRQAKRKQQ